jgi:hypothetical protein
MADRTVEFREAVSSRASPTDVPRPSKGKRKATTDNVWMEEASKVVSFSPHILVLPSTVKLTEVFTACCRHQISNRCRYSSSPSAVPISTCPPRARLLRP